ncbi:MAG: aminodeoxychorismate synthase component I [Telmatospirillum sp.]|nr:aminodeoxychorismate synthase component I [Telmatospirillum sp.]
MDVLSIPFMDPVAAFSPWADQPWAMLLDSAAFHPDRGRYAFIAADPFQTLVSTGDKVLLDGRPAGADPFAVLARELARWPHPRAPVPVPFAGGAVGLIGYEAGRYLERAQVRHRLPAGQPDMALGFYDVVAAFDLEDRRAWVIAARPEAEGRAAGMAERIGRAGGSPMVPPSCPPLRWRSELSRDAYRGKVRRILDYIRAGDVFQVNMTQRFLADRPEGFSDFAAYRLLRDANPAPFAAFLRLGDAMTVIGASPERFLSLSAQGAIETRPIKGTCRRAATAEADHALAVALAASRKDRAENLMITDLMRNDIGRSAEIGSVRVPTFAGVETYASVHHLVSVVEARLRRGLGPVDLLRGAFPGGSVTGAPKVRALEIIDELEVAPRGPYCGTVGWIGFDGAMDSNIVIRTVVSAGGRLITQAGGAIVADSDPEAEHAEMVTKARPALSALSTEDETCWFG